MIDKIRPYFNHPGFIEPFADATRTALGARAARPDGARLVFTAHSVPVGMAASSGSPTAGTARPALPGSRAGAGDTPLSCMRLLRLIAERAVPSTVPPSPSSTRAGADRPRVPWLEPDIREHLAGLAKEGVPGVVVVPVGFTSDHMEVVHDLDVEAASAAASLGLPFARAAAPMPDPRFTAMVTDLVLERMAGTGPAWLGDFGPAAGDCPADCCLGPGGRPPVDPRLATPGGRPPVDPRQRGETPLSPPSPGEPAQTAGPRASGRGDAA